MPTFDPTTTPTMTRKFADTTFAVPVLYSEGHALTSPEAAFLNSQLASVVGNAFSGDIRRAMITHNAEGLKAFTSNGGKAKDYVPATDPAVLGWDLAARFAEKFISYELGVSNRGTGASATSSDPVARMVNFLASEELKGLIVRKGLKVRDFQTAKNADGVSKWTETLEALIERKAETFRAQAEAMVAAQAAEADDSDLLDGVLEPTSTETPAGTEEPAPAA